MSVEKEYNVLSKRVKKLKRKNIKKLVDTLLPVGITVLPTTILCSYVVPSSQIQLEVRIHQEKVRVWSESVRLDRVLA